MRDILGKYSKGSRFVVFYILIPFWCLGFAYEYSYFKQLGLLSNDHLGARHYFYAGVFWVGQIVFGLFIYYSIKRFFSKDIHRDISKEAVEVIKKAGFKDAINMSRFIFVFTFFYWLLSFLEFSKDWFPGMMGLTWLLFYWNLMYFFGALLTGEKHTHVTLAVMFAIAIIFTISATGFLHARSALHTDAKPFRNDYLLIERVGDKFSVTAKSFSFPFPYIDKFLDLVFGSSSSGH